MASIVSCEVLYHNIWLVFAAALVCVVGNWIQMGFYQRGLHTTGMQRLGWLFLAAKVAGLSIWCTHFVAILAYDPGAPVDFDATLTIASSLVGVVGAGVSYFVAMRATPRYAAALGGMLMGLSIAAMHYFGMMAYRVEGFVSWDEPLVVLSVLIGSALGAGSLHVATHWRGRWRRPIAVALLVGATVGLHFVGMLAFRITPLMIGLKETNTGVYSALALAVLGMTILVIGAAIVSFFLDQDLRMQSYVRLQEMALHDGLTGLANRSNFRAHLSQALEVADRERRAVALIAIDLNDFKAVNDRFGHAAGDELLKQFARRLRALLGENEFPARLGGDEFALVKEAADPASLSDLLNRLSGALVERARVGEHFCDVRASVGVAIYPNDARDLETLINNADLAMYRAKAERSDQACFYERAMDERVRARRRRAADLRAAIANDALEVHYQKQASVGDGQTQGYEALARWPMPGEGFVSPAEFIPLAEECGLIDELGEWVLRTACTDAVRWAQPFKVAVNLSPLQLAKPHLPLRVAAILCATGLPPERLELELTESAIVRDRSQSLATILAIKALGVTIALDDFGTGHSSLSILRKFPFDKIKLDRSFLWEIETDKQAMAILRAVLALGRSLSIPVLAEGIETEGQLNMLREEACNQAQGYYLGRPAPMARLIADGQIALAVPAAEARPFSAAA